MSLPDCKFRFQCGGDISRFRCYIDESGNSDLESSDDQNHRFLSLTGVIIDDSRIIHIHDELESLKRRFFTSSPDDPVVLHRREIIDAKHAFRTLREERIRSEFDNNLVELLSSWEYIVISVCLDKKAHKEQYNVWRYDPYHYCLALLLERFVFFLERKNSKGDVMAESRGGKEDRRLKKSFSDLIESGTNFIDSSRFSSRFTSKEIKMKTKANNITGLQIADLLAHPSRMEILLDGGLVAKRIAPFEKRLIQVLGQKYDQVNGRIFGKKLLP